MLKWIERLRARRWLWLSVVNLRILIGFAFLPAGMKKVIGQPFTDPSNSGAFHDFLHAFYATGVFYPFVGAVQLLVAALLMTQRFAALGAALALPVIAAITVFCWGSGAGMPTRIVATLMLLGVIGLLVWDVRKWGGLIGISPSTDASEAEAPIDHQLWQRCGTAILILYAAVCAMSGGVYRPKGVELDNPAFYLLPLIATFPIVTWLIEARRRRVGR